MLLESGLVTAFAMQVVPRFCWAFYGGWCVFVCLGGFVVGWFVVSWLVRVFWGFLFV